MKMAILFLATILTIVLLDMMWLGYLSKGIYAENIGILMRKSGDTITPIWSAAAVVYLLIAIGIIYFVLPKANGDYLQALMMGALFGAITYGIYDFTNYAILANWTFKITIIDMLWGMTLCGVASVVVTFVQNRFIS